MTCKETRPESGNLLTSHATDKLVPLCQETRHDTTSHDTTSGKGQLASRLNHSGTVWKRDESVNYADEVETGDLVFGATA